MFDRVFRLFGRRPRVLTISQRLWDEVGAELARRGESRRESGAFLLAKVGHDSRRIARAVYLDDLDPECLTGSIHFKSGGYAKLWEICESEGLAVVADIHTHPGSLVEQSAIDKQNPMLAKHGHVAIIAPDFGRIPIEPESLGVHIYLGDQGWKSRFGRSAARAIAVKG